MEIVDCLTVFSRIYVPIPLFDRYDMGLVPYGYVFASRDDADGELVVTEGHCKGIFFVGL